MSGNSKPKMYGRERTDNESRLNAFKPVKLGSRAGSEEKSWVLFDANDPHHASIPAEIRRPEQLPYGALVISVDMTPLSQKEKDMSQPHDGHDLPPQSHAVYLTAREPQLVAAANALRKTIDRRARADEGITAANHSTGMMVLWDKAPAGEKADEYHLQISGNNHPASPVPELSRICANGTLYALMERLSVDGPSGSPGYHKHTDKPLLGDKNYVVSPHLARELCLEIADQVRRSTGRHEAGLKQRMEWPAGNRIDATLEMHRASDEKMVTRAAQEQVMRERRGAPKDASAVLGRLDIEPSRNGMTPVGKK